jgi:hypothetical protein
VNRQGHYITRGCFTSTSHLTTLRSVVGRRLIRIEDVRSTWLKEGKNGKVELRKGTMKLPNG